MRLLLLAILLIISLNAKEKIALLIGNKDYKKREYRLKNPINDINLLEKKLKSIGFKVIKLSNATYSQTIKALEKFYKQIDNNTIAIIYFSGHGVHSSIDNKNYLIPIGA